ncbi:MAG: outer membrane lipid asymmetry maintenance protein MlaD [Pseudomonadota bacterium]
MSETTAETSVGAIVLLAAAGFVAYAATVADLGFGGGGGTTLVAEFRRAEGIAPGGDVRIAGVKIGSISSMVLDPARYRARVTLNIQPGIDIPDDTAAKITQASLLGDSYIALTPGASEFMLQDGELITFTQDSVNLLDLVGRFIAGGGSSDGEE